MRLTFQIRFQTQPGQSLWLSGNHALLGCEREGRAIPMQYRDAETWSVTFDLPRGAVPDADLNYHYVLRSADGAQVRDWGRDRVVNPESFRAEEVLIVDSWNAPGCCENVFYTEPFKHVLLAPNQTGVSVPAPPQATHRFTVKAPLLARSQTLCLLGNHLKLGNWGTAAPVLLNRMPVGGFLWVELDLAGVAFPVEYKFGVYDFDRQGFVRCEDGPNRVLREPGGPGRFVVVNDGFARLPNTTWRGAGVAIPVFSLRSEKSFGVGEFTDLKLLADWCVRTGLKVIQILPVNDTSATHTWTDSYPYSAISAFALHPQYLNLSRVVAGKNKSWLKKLEPERRRLNALAGVDYEAVLKTKLDFLQRIFPSSRAANSRRRDYREFFAANRHWLVPYAAFCHLRDRFGTADFTQWPEHSRYDADEIAALAGEGSDTRDEVALHYFIQFHLHLQLRQATEYAHAHGIILKGDLAIGVSRHGADAWQSPELYHLEVQAGAPPDPFAVKGQNWGFPTYDWPRMKEDGFAWWRHRFEQMAAYFDAFRVDHILGFFRIWSIPLYAVEGILGRFVPALPVTREEFNLRGLAFDRGRFVQPFITDEIVRNIFGPEAEAVKRRYLDPRPNGRYALPEEFATQRRVERYFASRAATERNRKLKLGLFDLVSNVILLADETAPNEKFHFRFDMQDGASFRALDPGLRAQLQELYVDYFYRRQDGFWRQEAMQKLPALKQATNLLICGEDLGVVPDCVPGVMQELGLLSLEIQRMPKNPGQEFFRPSGAPYLAVVTPGTHDMSTLRGWWREDRQLTQRFFNTELGRAGEAPPDCDAAINREIIVQHLACPAMWSVFQLQDLLGMDERLRRANPGEERINVPANPCHYWRYRMHLTLEELLAAGDFNHALGQLVRESGR
jgi:4-alpha-glucanotransferase